MSEVNNNANQFDVSSSFESVGELNNSSGSETENIITESNFLHSSEQTNDLESIDDAKVSDLEASETPSEVHHSTKKMDWQKVAHKLREYNRKLLKKVFKLEQDLADIENKFKTQTEKSQNSDRILAKQAEEIKEFQEQIATLSKQLETSKQEAQSRKLLVENLSQQLTSSQKQTANLERECALVQETCNDRADQLITKTKEAEELSTRLSRQQRYTLQYKAALDNHLNKATTAESELQETSNNSSLEVKNSPIQAWSSPAIDTPVSLPITNAKPVEVKSLSDRKQLEPNTSKITEWPAPAIAQTKTTKNKKSKSLASVKLPRFPRQS